MADTTPATPPPPAPAAVASSPTASPTKKKPAAHFQDADGLFQTVCRAFMAKKCQKTDCKHVHDAQLCRLYWKSGECKFGKDCKRNHFVTVGGSATPTAVQTDNVQTDAANKPTDTQKKKKNKDKKDKKPTATTTTDATEPTNAKKPQQQPKDKSSSKPKVRTVKGKNTECFEPMTTPVDVRITYDLGTHRDAFSTSLTTRDVLLAPNIFSDFNKGELYATLVKELEQCGIPEERLLKMWHGNEKLDGTHLIADDKTRWKQNCPTFQLVIDRLQKFFQLNVQATRFNWYRDTSQWKPFHFDAAAVKPEIAAKQNFTVAVSFGATRDAAFEHAKTRTVVSVPQPDGCVYAFARDTNIIWRHGILQDVPVRQEGRISVIAWGWIDGMVDTTEPTA